MAWLMPTQLEARVLIIKWSVEFTLLNPRLPMNARDILNSGLCLQKGNNNPKDFKNW